MNKTELTPFLILIAILAATGARADDPAGGYLEGTEINCPGIGFSEATRTACNSFAYRQADKELNTVYRELMAGADSQEKLFLKNMQRAWIDLRNAQCGLVKSYYKTVGSEKWKTECEAVMTIRRIQELKALGTGIKW